MKKYFLLFAAGGLLTLASCGGDTTPAETINVDSIAAVKADSIAMALKMQSDSTIAVQAQAAADSMAQIMKMDSVAAATKAAISKSTGKKTTTKTTPTAPTVTPPTTPPPVTNPKDARFNEDVKKQQEQDKTNKKADRFNR